MLSSQQLINGEMYPPTVDQVPIRMNYPPWIPSQDKIAIGHEVFGLLPGLGMYATLWLREHNRVCDVLKAEHPTWDDEQLFQTARLVIIGESEQDTHRHREVFILNTFITLNLSENVQRVSQSSFYCNGLSQRDQI